MSEREVLLARVVIPKHTDIANKDNIILATKTCICVTTSGELWEIKVSEFHTREDLIRKTWETDRKHFTKRQ